jgi:hypothetical protein
MRHLSLDKQFSYVKSWDNLVELVTNKFDIVENCLRCSDTLFVKGGSDSEDLKTLIEFSKCILEKGIELDFPVRGGIAYGNAVLDKEKDLAYGDGLVKAYDLADRSDWIGTCCEHDLPQVQCLWDFDLIFVYPVPMKDEIVTFVPAVSWNVPDYIELRRKTEKFFPASGSQSFTDWKYSNRIQNTIIFSLYLRMVKFGLIKAEPSAFPGHPPIYHIYESINEICHDIHFRKHGLTLTHPPNGGKIFTRDQNDRL